MVKVPYVLYNYTPKASDCSKQGFMSLAYNNMVSDDYHVIDRQQTDRQTHINTDGQTEKTKEGHSHMLGSIFPPVTGANQNLLLTLNIYFDPPTISGIANHSV